jgi:DNA-binding transcriptional regulator YiaG
MDSKDLVTLTRVRALARTGRARRIRLKAGASLAEVAIPIGVSKSTVLRWEVGERRPRGEPALKYADVLDALEARR